MDLITLESAHFGERFSYPLRMTWIWSSLAGQKSKSIIHCMRKISRNQSLKRWLIGVRKFFTNLKRFYFVNSFEIPNFAYCYGNQSWTLQTDRRIVLAMPDNSTLPVITRLWHLESLGLVDEFLELRVQLRRGDVLVGQMFCRIMPVSFLRAKIIVNCPTIWDTYKLFLYFFTWRSGRYLALF